MPHGRRHPLRARPPAFQAPNDGEILSNIFRVFHTIKGTCGFLNLPRLEKVAHAGEDLLSTFRGSCWRGCAASCAGFLTARAPGPQPSAGAASPQPAPQPIYRFGRWILNPAQRSVTGDDGRAAELTSGEFDLLAVFAERPNRVLSRNQLMDYLHGNQTPAFDRSIDVRIRWLRQKIEADPNSPELIKTVRHAGYMFTAVLRKA